MFGCATQKHHQPVVFPDGVRTNRAALAKLSSNDNFFFFFPFSLIPFILITIKTGIFFSRHNYIELNNRINSNYLILNLIILNKKQKRFEFMST